MEGGMSGSSGVLPPTPNQPNTVFVFGAKSMSKNTIPIHFVFPSHLLYGVFFYEDGNRFNNLDDGPGYHLGRHRYHLIDENDALFCSRKVVRITHPLEP